MRIFVTGINGFIGHTLFEEVKSRDGFSVNGSVRNLKGDEKPFYESGNIDRNTEWISALNKVDVVVHLAARAHVVRDSSADPLSEFRKVNVDGTIQLASEAAAAGVKRFIFLSSIGVNGSVTDQPFTEDDTPNPNGPYAQSKLEAELRLKEVQKLTGMEIVIIRPPLVYGPNAPGNFGSLVRWVRKGVPLPLGAINNKRTFIAVDNLVDLIITCMTHPDAKNQLFLAGDGEDISTTQLLKLVADAMGKKIILVPVPQFILSAGAVMLGKKQNIDRLIGSLQLDITKAQSLLGWTPPFSIAHCLSEYLKPEVSNDKSV
ncbi:NAD-dependent epimerase/dehydratase family protein [Neptuniibacter sp.]|uniref:NAD-dependent epimerase/dehydratase family protein n=1 Tax=Neptuniibacter sp. TaxID=1962643 RepID=UPI003B5AABC9